MAEGSVVQLGIVPVISASRRSRRARRCNAVPATSTRDYTNQYFLHISRVFPNWPAARATPLDMAMPCFYDCLLETRISIESGGCASFLVFQIKTPFNCRQPCVAGQKPTMTECLQKLVVRQANQRDHPFCSYYWIVMVAVLANALQICDAYLDHNVYYIKNVDRVTITLKQILFYVSL